MLRHCLECGRSFNARGRNITCSPDCRRARQRAQYLAWAARQVKQPRRPAATTRPNDCWRPEELILLGAVPDRELARRTGRSTGAVAQKRQSLGIPYLARTRRLVAWTDEVAALLGKAPDRDIAARLDILPESVYQERSRRGIAAHQGGGNRTCAWCGERFPAESRREKYCDPGCRAQSIRYRYKRRQAEAELAGLAAELDRRLNP